ncbi:MAG: cytochrome c3 family protein [Ignavibacteriaceae bacterium]|nr:cytochrome c3 family protein [Ignavibacteriaceae bacterium]
MKRRIMLAIPILIIYLIPLSAYGATDQCYTCHSALEDKESKLFAEDIHFKKGISCSGCHGGDNTTEDNDAAMNKEKGFIGVPKGNKITEVCARCHASEKMMKSFGSKLPVNQFDNLINSVHGKTSTAGGGRIVQCTTCHTAHGIKSVKDPLSPVYATNIPKTCSKCHADANYMRTYNPTLAVDQYTQYLTSVHGKLNSTGDPKPAQCASCHGSHDIKPVKDIKSKVYPVNLPYTCSGCHSNKEYMAQYKIPTDQFEKYARSVHGQALLVKNDPGAPACNSCHGNHGAAPPGIESISKVCGTCHALNEELFSASPHKAAFDRKGYPECETCHGNHEIITATNKLLGVDKDGVCIRCHGDQNSSGYKSAYIMRKLIDSLDETKQSAMILINEAEQKGMEITEAKFKLRDINQVKLEARTQVHTFDPAKFKDIVGKGLVISRDATADAKVAIHEYYFRRVGLGVSVFLISLLAFGLFLYLRRIEKK